MGDDTEQGPKANISNIVISVNQLLNTKVHILFPSCTVNVYINVQYEWNMKRLSLSKLFVYCCDLDEDEITFCDQIMHKFK